MIPSSDLEKHYELLMLMYKELIVISQAQTETNNLLYEINLRMDNERS